MLLCSLAFCPPLSVSEETETCRLFGSAKVPQRNCVTKILQNVWVNFLVPLPQNPCFAGLWAGNPLELFRNSFVLFVRFWLCVSFFHVYLNSVQQVVSGELAGECLQARFERHGLPPQRAPLDTVYPLKEHLNNVQRMVSGGYCEGLFPDTVCWTRLRNT